MNKLSVMITQPSGLGKRADIQYLRAFSVCIVIIFHARARILPNGYLGVDLFFLISGFVLTPQILKIFSSANNQAHKVSLNFLKKRISLQNLSPIWVRAKIIFFFFTMNFIDEVNLYTKSE